jgi:hypothetical protein
MPPRLVLLLVAAILLAVLVLNSCSPAGRVARHYNRYTRGYKKEVRKPMHNLPLR